MKQLQIKRVGGLVLKSFQNSQGSYEYNANIFWNNHERR
jgi:hypothetical protein